jgi:hypothetical protein
VRIEFARASSEDDRFTIPEVLELARQIRDLITNARALTGQDLCTPVDFRAAQTGAPDAQADQTLRELLAALTTDLKALYASFAVNDPQSLAPLVQLGLTEQQLSGCKHLFDLSAAVDLHAVGRAVSVPIDLDLVRWQLMRLAAFGISEAIPRSLAGSGSAERAMLLVQSCAIYRQGTRSHLEADQALTSGDVTSALQKIFGKNFCAMPVVNKDAWGPVRSALGRARNSEAATVQAWLARLGYVRQGVARFNEVINCAESLETGDKLANLVVGQIPEEESASDWVGSTTIPASGVVSYAIHAPFGIPKDTDIRGLLVDDWIERVPASFERTYMAFHYDGPGACAPQAILLAVPPDPRNAWDLESLEAVVRETLDLAKIRAVDYHALKDGGQLLPALYFAWNSNNETISANFQSA